MSPFRFAHCFEFSQEPDFGADEEEEELNPILAARNKKQETLCARSKSILKDSQQGDSRNPFKKASNQQRSALKAIALGVL